MAPLHPITSFCFAPNYFSYLLCTMWRWWSCLFSDRSPCKQSFSVVKVYGLPTKLLNPQEPRICVYPITVLVKESCRRHSLGRCWGSRLFGHGLVDYRRGFIRVSRFFRVTLFDFRDLLLEFSGFFRISIFQQISPQNRIHSFPKKTMTKMSLRSDTNTGIHPDFNSVESFSAAMATAPNVEHGPPEDAEQKILLPPSPEHPQSGRTLWHYM